MSKQRTPEQERSKRAKRVERARLLGLCTQCCGASEIKPEPGKHSCRPCLEKAEARYQAKAQAWKEMQTYEQEQTNRELVALPGGYF